MVSRGVRCFHVVDLDAAFGREPHYPGFSAILAIKESAVSLQGSGGIRSLDSALWMLDLGASRSSSGL